MLSWKYFRYSMSNLCRDCSLSSPSYFFIGTSNYLCLSTAINNSNNIIYTLVDIVVIVGYIYIMMCALTTSNTPTMCLLPSPTILTIQLQLLLLMLIEISALSQRTFLIENTWRKLLGYLLFKFTSGGD